MSPPRKLASVSLTKSSTTLSSRLVALCSFCWISAWPGLPLQAANAAQSPKFCDATIQFCLTFKNLFGLELRKTTRLVELVLQLYGLAWPVPEFSSLCRRQRDLDASRFRTPAVQQACTYWWIQQVSSSRVKASGSVKSMALNAAASDGATVLQEEVNSHYFFHKNARMRKDSVFSCMRRLPRAGNWSEASESAVLATAGEIW